MFDDNFFEDWLDTQAQTVMNKIADGQGIAPEQMMILMLKAQTNHFAHLDIELRGEMKALREDMDKRFEQVDKRFEQMDKRFEQLQLEAAKRFEQVDKRFEQVDKRFETLTSRIDHFMVWSFATTLTVGGLVIAAIKFLP
jgi:uncharacterized protein (DUF3084 family)